MDKKLIISKTGLFLSIILFVLLFQNLFGADNTLIGVTVITAALMLLKRDFTIEPTRYLAYLIGLNLFLGIAAFIATKNLWIALPINFITVFAIGFLLCFDLKSNLYIPFGLQYLFMLSAPVSEGQLGIRLLSLTVGSIFIMLLQMIFNKNRLSKSGNKFINNIFKDLLRKMEFAIEKKDINELNGSIKKNIVELKKIIYHKRKKSFYLTERGRIKLNIIVALDHINDRISDFNETNQLKKIEHLYNQMNKISKNHKYIYILRNIKEQNNKLSEDKTKDNLDILCNSLIELNNLKEDQAINIKGSIPNKFNFRNTLKRNFKTNTLRFSYAFRLALCITISLFIMDYFKIYEGRWMAYTVFSLIQPYSEHSKIKSKQKFKGTLIGGILSLILFSIFKNETIKSIIVMGAGYLDGYNNNYQRRTVYITISALGVASITASVTGQLLYRILFVGLGIIVSLLANKYIYPYSLNDAENDLLEMGNSTIEELEREFQLYISGEDNHHIIANLYIISSLIEDKLISIKRFNYKKVIEDKKRIVKNIYLDYVIIEKNIV